MRYLVALVVAICASAQAAPTLVSVSHPAKAVPGIPVSEQKQKVASVNPIVFVTQFPTPGAFVSIGSVFGTQLTTMAESPRGGDLWIRYGDGTLRNLTQEAGFGMTGQQGANAIAVRDPAVSWDATKIIFSMVIGAPVTQYQVIPPVYWQLYEVTQFGQGQTVHIARVTTQPAQFNNIEPSYAADGGILFASDQPRGGQRYLYPQRDEYESSETITGVWKIDPNGAVWQLTDSPSGISRPSLDSYGRVVFTQWDHMQRDQQCDTPSLADQHGCFNFSSEADASAHGANVEFYPELRNAASGNVNSHVFNQFFPWSVNSDGTSQETLNHIGAHELHGYFNDTLNDDPAIHDFQYTVGSRTNPNIVGNWLHISADWTTPGYYLGIEAPEFFTDAAGGILSINSPIGAAADTFKVNYVTVPADDSAPTNRFRNASVLANGNILASWTAATGQDSNIGTAANPKPQYNFRIRFLTAPPKNLDGTTNGYATLGTLLTNGISKSISFWNPDSLVTYSGPLWELDPAEVVARPVPPITTTALQTPELAPFADAGVDPVAFKAWMVQNNLALFVSRDVTSRDDADQQQPYNLQVPNGRKTVGNNGKLYQVQYLKIYSGDAVRGYADRNGRRKLAVELNDPMAVAANLPAGNGAPTASVKVALDGSAAWFAPARKSMTWETTAPDGTPVVRERYWIGAQPGEIRACDSCHGANTYNQAGQVAPTNTPAALTAQLIDWKQRYGGGTPPVCTNQQPLLPPSCDTGVQTGGTWQQAAYPTCTWTYAGGTCPAPPPTQRPILCTLWKYAATGTGTTIGNSKGPIICQPPYTVQ